MKRIITILSLLTLIFSTQLFAKKFTVGIDDWKPFIYFENDEPKGISIDMFKKLAIELGYDIEFKYLPWSRSLMMLKSGEIDAMGNLSYSKKREEFLTYVKPPYYEQKILFYTRKGEKELIKKHEDLYNQIMIVGRDYVYYEKFDNDQKIKKENLVNFDMNSNLVTLEYLTINMLLKKRIDVMIAPNAILNYLLKKHNIEGSIVPSQYDPQQSDFIHVGISNKSPFIEDIDKINKAMKKILSK
jgi:polar amino acid transport system substrate-binding protein